MDIELILSIQKTLIGVLIFLTFAMIYFFIQSQRYYAKALYHKNKVKELESELYESQIEY